MAALVRNFLAFARTQSVRREGVNLNQQLTELVQSREAETRSIGVEVSLELDPLLPTTEADPAQLRQVFANLLTNALQAVLDRPSPGRVLIRSEACGSVLRLAVEDNGPGISREVQARMFEPFFTTRGVGVGTGLGLSTAHGIVAEHGGTITYQPSALGGACFIVELPLIQPQRTLQPHNEMDSQFHFYPKAAAAAKPVDDEEAIGDLLKEMLNMLGYDTAVFSRGQDALAAIEQREFDVVLSDYRMPGMDGKTFYKKAAECRPELAHRFVFLTGDTVNDETLSFVNEVGAHCIGKPFHLHTVEQAVNRAKAGEPATEPFAN
jgi:CheY-like chemotaxis protein/anti-sigma regulatory factor (Ser/Thr protein kinase)